MNLIRFPKRFKWRRRSSCRIIIWRIAAILLPSKMAPIPKFMATNYIADEKRQRCILFSFGSTAAIDSMHKNDSRNNSGVLSALPDRLRMDFSFLFLLTDNQSRWRPSWYLSCDCCCCCCNCCCCCCPNKISNFHSKFRKSKNFKKIRIIKFSKWIH